MRKLAWGALCIGLMATAACGGSDSDDGLVDGTDESSDENTDEVTDTNDAPDMGRSHRYQ
jgi:hypothetical protein